jgi:hypothetical protein
VALVGAEWIDGERSEGSPCGVSKLLGHLSKILKKTKVGRARGIVVVMFVNEDNASLRRGVKVLPRSRIVAHRCTPHSGQFAPLSVASPLRDFQTCPHSSAIKA